MITVKRELIERTLRFLETHGAHGKAGVGLMDELRGVLSEPERKPMTDEDIDAVEFDIDFSTSCVADLAIALRKFARAVEAFHGIKGHHD